MSHFGHCKERAGSQAPDYLFYMLDVFPIGPHLHVFCLSRSFLESGIPTAMRQPGSSFNRLLLLLFSGKALW